MKKFIITSLGCRTKLTEAPAHPREIFYPAIARRAHSLILAHNHPGSDPTPSEADLEFTRVLLEASRLLCIPLLD